MKRIMLKSKIHRAVITDADPNYEGSITIDPLLMEKGDLLPYEQVHVWNITRGARIITYAIPGKPGSGEICINGAGALLNRVGDIVIIASFVELDESEVLNWKPLVLFLDDKNRVKKSVRLSIMELKLQNIKE